MEWLWLILFGIIGGVLGGMGMGGGTLLIPLLTIFLNISQQNAQGINLIAFLPMSIVAIIIENTCCNARIKFLPKGILSSISYIKSFFILLPTFVIFVK